LASFDTRTGKLLGSFKGKCSGSIRSIARHPELPVVASCGLDRYLRIWNTKTRELLAAAFLKQQLTSVVIDSNFVAETTTTAGDAADVNPDKVESEVNHVDKVEINEHSAGSKRKSSKKDGKKQRGEDGKKSKIKKKKAKLTYEFVFNVQVLLVSSGAMLPETRNGSRIGARGFRGIGNVKLPLSSIYYAYKIN